MIKDGKVLLVKRTRPPSQGLWALPGGKINLGETLQQAARREVKEETGLDILPCEPIYCFDVIDRDAGGRVRFHYVIADLFAEYKGGRLKAGDDAGDAGWFSLEELKKIEVNESTKMLVTKYLNSQ